MLGDVHTLISRLGDALDLPWAVCPVTEPSQTDAINAGAKCQLGRGEQSIFDSIQSPKRRAEFLAGRLAAKTVLSRPPFSLDQTEIDIVRTPSGAPILLSDDAISISISHSHGCAVAVASSETTVGVDLERNEVRPDALVRYFFSDTEKTLLEALPASQRQAAVSRLWTRKEAAVKVAGLGGRVPFRSLDCSAEQVTIGDHLVHLISDSRRDFTLTIAWEKEPSHHG